MIPGPKRGKHNHEQNLDIVIRELRSSSHADGVTLQHLANVCVVSKRHIYRYLRELEEIGLPIERPLVNYPGRSGGGHYKLKSDSQSEEWMLLMILHQARECYRKQYKQYLFLINITLYLLALKGGCKLPLNVLVKLMDRYCEI
ncbi:transcriptional regulator [Desulfotomaculum sp. 1211_IL3151]|uniref:transcriptional regulator n=1 Tax=Desulfotomaculum sp. 1211_IL3151 TaxID=3084055 RepID=UPI002FDB638A